MALVTITHPAITGVKRIYCDTVRPSGKKNLGHDPEANVKGPSEVHTQTYENIKFIIQGIKFTQDSDALTWGDVLKLYRAKYNGENPAILNVSYGYGSNERDLFTISPEDVELTDMPCILESFDYPINVRETREGYIPTGSITLMETK